MRRMNALLFVEGLAGGCIMLPVILAGKSLEGGMICILLGTALGCLAVRPVLELAKAREGKAASPAERGLGLMIGAAVFWYSLSESAVFLNWWSYLAGAYLLPWIPVQILCLLPLAAGIYMSRKKPGERGAFCRVIAPAMLAVLILLLVTAGMLSETDWSMGSGAFGSDHILWGSWEVFACMGASFGPVLAGNGGGGVRRARSIRRSGCIRMAVAAGFYIAVMQTWGSAGLGEDGFLQLAMMSRVKTGGEMERCIAAILVLLLLVSLTMGIAGAFWRLRRLGASLYPQVLGLVTGAPEQSGSVAGGEAPYMIWVVSILLAYSAAAGFRDAQTAICFYRAYNLQLLALFLLVFSRLLALRKGEKLLKGRLLTKKGCRF